MLVFNALMSLICLNIQEVGILSGPSLMLLVSALPLLTTEMMMSTPFGFKITTTNLSLEFQTMLDGSGLVLTLVLLKVILSAVLFLIILAQLVTNSLVKAVLLVPLDFFAQLEQNLQKPVLKTSTALLLLHKLHAQLVQLQLLDLFLFPLVYFQQPNLPKLQVLQLVPPPQQLQPRRKIRSLV